MKTAYERLGEIFSDQAFLDANQDLDNFDSVYNAVVIRDASITKAECQEFITLLSERMHADELSEDDLEDVAGGVIVTITALGVAKAVALAAGACGACYVGGTAFGKFLYNCRH